MRPAASSQVFDIHGRLITTLHSDQNRIPIDINKVPQNLQNAFIAAEDNRFYDHIGIDPRGIFRAVWANVTHHALIQRLNAANPDAVIFGGDIIDGNIAFVLADGSYKNFTKIKAPLGVYAVYGNHAVYLKYLKPLNRVILY